MRAPSFAVGLGAALMMVLPAKADDAALCSAMIGKMNADLQSLKELPAVYDQHRRFAAGSNGDESEYGFAVSAMDITAASFDTAASGIRGLIGEARLLGYADARAPETVAAATEDETERFAARRRMPWTRFSVARRPARAGFPRTAPRETMAPCFSPRGSWPCWASQP